MVTKVVEIEAGALAYVDDVLEHGKGWRTYNRSGVVTLDPNAADWDELSAESWDDVVREMFRVRSDREHVDHVLSMNVDLVAGTVAAELGMFDE